MKTSFLIGLVSIFIQSISYSQLTTSFYVFGECGMCQQRIEQASMIQGVKQSTWDINTKLLTVTYDTGITNEINIHTAIALVGHDTKKVSATNSVYNDLPDCCKYREEENHQDHNEDEHPVFLYGFIREAEGNNPAIGANVFWLETSNGVLTDNNGNFKLGRLERENTLMIRYPGYNADTIKITNEKRIEITLHNEIKLNEFKVVERLSSIEISKLTVLKVEKIGEKELQKAACCNLSESFETNPSVDVTYTDAITGTKQIQMLGLAGPNIQITSGNMPDLRGLSAIQGLTFVPGSWIKNIYLNKGTGSVMNGFESIAGQLNLEFKEMEDTLFFNLYANQGGRTETNLSLSKQFNDHVGTYLHTHASDRFLKNDLNRDGFLDNPLAKNVFIHNGWNFTGHNGVEMKLGVEVNAQNRIGGEVDFNKNEPIDSTAKWGLVSDLRRVKGWLKAGKVFADAPGKSMGLQMQFSYFDENTVAGIKRYEGKQNSYYVNYLFQNIIGTTDYEYTLGVSFMGDEYLEKLGQVLYKRSEYVPGVFGELTISRIQNLKIVTGLRGDYHSIYGAFVTPRLHLKYDLDDKTNIRISAGRGQRTANIISENLNMLATSRQIIIKSDSTQPTYAYGLKPEIAWNIGTNLTREFNVEEKKGVFSVDFYHTNFINQIVVDWENPREISFYNLSGKSYSNSVQLQLDYELIKNLDIRMAYRFYDVKTTYNGEDLNSKPLLARNRAFINLAYTIKEKWAIDITANWTGEQRIPSTTGNPLPLQRISTSPHFWLFNSQITKNWKKLALYLGVENALDYRQLAPIIDSKNPFGGFFDSSLIWGPIFGRNIYAGLRYRF